MQSLFSRLFPAPRYLRLPTVGLDISDRAIKYAELVDDHNKLHLGKFGEVEIPEGAIKDGVILDQDKLANIIGLIKKDTGLNTFHISLPEEKAYLVEMEVPAGARDLHTAIELHLEEHVPLEVGSTIFDYEIAHRPEESDKNTFVVAVSALEDHIAREYAEVLGKAGCKAFSFEFESQALARAVISRGAANVTMIVDIGREQSDVSIVSRGVVRLTSSISLGGNTISRAISEDLKISFEEANKLKEKEGLDRRGQERSPFDSIVRVAAILRDEIYQRLIYWDNGRARSNNKDVVSRIVLCGGNANVPGLLEYLTSGTKVPVSIGNPWVNILSFNESVPAITSRESLKYCTALGLALRSAHNQT
ncbi:MAG: pilus assembly protein PilM [Patescibacteria group bacterium]